MCWWCFTRRSKCWRALPQYDTSMQHHSYQQTLQRWELRHLWDFKHWLLDTKMIQTNITFQRFGHGFYLAPNSSKCHDYTQGACGYRAMLVCDVCPGNLRQIVRIWQVHLLASIVCMDKLVASWTILRLLCTIQMLSCLVTSLFIGRMELGTLLQTNPKHSHSLFVVPCTKTKKLAWQNFSN